MRDKSVVAPQAQVRSATTSPKASGAHYFSAVTLTLGLLVGASGCTHSPLITPSDTPKMAPSHSMGAESAAPLYDARAWVADYMLDSDASYQQAHSAALTETADGRLLATWFAGTHERHPDVSIYVAEFANEQWSAGREVATGVQPDGSRLPTWNPVLFTAPDGNIWLFYKVGANPRQWWGEYKISTDGGRSFGAATRLPEGILGPIKNKLLITEMGSWLAPSSREADLASATGTSDTDWTLVFESSSDGGKSWSASAPVASPAGLDAIQPSILQHADGRLQAIARTRQGVLASSFSADRGRSWSPLFALALPNPSSGTDAVTLADGRHLLIYNPVAHSPETPGKGLRYPLALALSHDGIHWREVMRLESTPLVSGYAYPAIMQTRAGLVQIAYTYGRKRIKQVTIDPRWLSLEPKTTQPN